ncbi:MAG: hypothetical protein IPJ75_12495 [Ignavibacteriales bacterium]|nr:hypothetical protein [Ignavibacteriales bacterium]
MQVVSSLGNGENILSAILENTHKNSFTRPWSKRPQQFKYRKVDFKKLPDTKIIVMDLVAMEKDIYEFIKVGVSGFY